MIACYDLARCPPTYDVVAFLALLEQERLRRGEEHVDLHILPGPASGFRRDSLWPRSVEERRQMLERVLVPLCWMLPSVRSVEVRTNRAVAGWGKNEYHVGLPAIVKALSAGSRPLRPWGVIKMPERWPRQITFTLREADHHPLRNSGTEEWVAAAGMLADRGFNVTIIRDTARADEPLGGPREDVVRVDPTASREIGARALTYDCATLNVGVSNGPMWMAIFKDAPVLMLRPTTNAAGGCYDDAFYKQHRLPRGSQLPCSPPHQRLVWEDDARDSIVRAVEEMLVEVAA